MNDTKIATSPDEDNVFATMLSQIDKGRCLNELSDALRQCVAAVRATGKGATLTLKLSIKPLDKEGDQVEVIDDVKTALPSAGHKLAMFFTGEDGSLLRNDPRQVEMDYVPRVTDGGKAPAAPAKSGAAGNG